MRNIEIVLHEIATDGLPDMDMLVNKVAFLWDGNIVNGWPLLEEDPAGSVWEGNDDVARPAMFGGVTHWIEFPQPLYSLAKPKLPA